MNLTSFFPRTKWKGKHFEKQKENFDCNLEPVLVQDCDGTVEENKRKCFEKRTQQGLQ